MANHTGVLKFYVGSPIYWAVVGITAFIFIAPIVNTEWFFHLGKLSFLGVSIIFTGAYIFLNREKYIYTYPKTLTFATLLYILWITLANTVFSSHPEYTVIGWQNWNGGLVANVIYWSLFLLVGFRRNEELENTTSILESFIKLLLVFGASVAFVTILEALGFDVFLSSTLAKSLGVELTRTTFPILSVGNAGWLSGIFALIAPMTFYLVKKKYYSATIVISILFLVGIAATRSNLNAIIFTVLMLSFTTYIVKDKRFFVAATLAVLGLLPTYATQALIELNEQLRQYNIVHREFGANEFDVSQTSSSLMGRKVIYSATIRNIFERPLTGWGYETLLFNFYNRLTPAEENFYLREVMLADKDETVTRDEMTIIASKEEHGIIKRRAQVFFMVKPHSYLLEEIYSNGIAGLVFLSFLLFNIISGFKSRLGTLSHILFISIITYLSYLMIWFLNPSVSPLAFIVLGIFLSFRDFKED